MVQTKTPFVVRRWTGGKWVPYAPRSDAAGISLPDSSNLEDYMAAHNPDRELVTITHNLDGYPKVLLLAYQYGAGISGAGEGPAGGTNPMSYPCREEYPSRNQVTVYTPKVIADMGSKRTLAKLSATEYIITFDGMSVDSLYVKLVLNMGGTVAAAAGLNLMAAQPVEGGG